MVSLVVATGLAELALRVAAHRGGNLARLNAWDPFKVKVEPDGLYGYRPRPFSVFPYGVNDTDTATALKQAHENAAGYRGPLVAVPKPAGTVRVILLGESTTHGFGVSDSETI